MTIPHDVAHCVGREIPFGTTYSHPECRSCARASAVLVFQIVLMGPVRFDGECPLKIREETE